MPQVIVQTSGGHRKLRHVQSPDQHPTFAFETSHNGCITGRRRNVISRGTSPTCHAASTIKHVLDTNRHTLQQPCTVSPCLPFIKRICTIERLTSFERQPSRRQLAGGLDTCNRLSNGWPAWDKRPTRCTTPRRHTNRRGDGIALQAQQDAGKGLERVLHPEHGRSRRNGSRKHSHRVPDALQILLADQRIHTHVCHSTPFCFLKTTTLSKRISETETL